MSLVTCKAIEGVSLDYRTKEAKRKCANDTVREIVESSSARADTCSSHCQMNSFASLENVRRLKISRGYKNGPRARESITGIWIEYWDSAEPKIVGQWLKEGKSLDLDRGDILTEISFWTDRPRDFARGAKIGDLNITVHVVGIQLSTANGNSLFWGEMRRNRLPLIYHHNYMQRLVRRSHLNLFPLVLSNFTNEGMSRLRYRGFLVQSGITPASSLRRMSLQNPLFTNHLFPLHGKPLK